MIGRLWYPQFDVFDTIRRLVILLHDFESPPGPERLYIADFYFANPPLLHQTSMKMAVRQEFLSLQINRPDKTFLNYPSAPLLFHKMEAIQREAMTALSGKALIDVNKLKTGRVELTDLANEILILDSLRTEEESKLSVFLTKSFAATEEVGNFDLRRCTGLRRSI